jgi:hypothetical protein
MKTPNTIEEEIDKIRLAIYEEIKDMTPSQRTEYYRKSGEATAKKYGFQIVTSIASSNRKIGHKAPLPRRAAKVV